MGLTIEIIAEDVVAAAEWASFRYSESIGQPDEMSVDVVGFKTDPLFTENVEERFANPDNYFYCVARLDGAVLFNGLVRGITMKKPAQGAMTYTLEASGWAFLLPKRLVGAPNGTGWYYGDTATVEALIAEGQLPEAECIDGTARWYLTPTPGGVQSLFGQYWTYPKPVDTTTYVTAVLPAEATGDAMNFSGTDMEGVLNDLAAAGSASAMWWMANDGGGYNGLALHFGIMVIPDDGDDGEDLGAGLPSVDTPTVLAPYDISDDPDWEASILANSMSFRVDHTQRASSCYVRGATGFVLDMMLNPNEPVGYSIGGVMVGGTGWVGAMDGGIWGAEYVDAPAAVSEEQRDAYGNAFLASREIPGWTGTVTVVGYDGWHIGQAIKVTDADYGFDAKWFLIRGVSMTQKDPWSIANEYTLTLGDVLSPSLGWALRARRLEEERKEVDPGQKFVVWHGDLLLDVGGTSKIEGQFATASGTARKVAGVGARWNLYLKSNDIPVPGGNPVEDPHDTANAYYLSDETTTTDEFGKVYAILHAGASATAADAADISIDVILP